MISIEKMGWNVLEAQGQGLIHFYGRWLGKCRLDIQLHIVILPFNSKSDAFHG